MIVCVSLAALITVCSLISIVLAKKVTVEVYLIGSLVIYALMMVPVVYLLATLGEEATHNTSTYSQLESFSKFTRNCGDRYA